MVVISWILVAAKSLVHLYRISIREWIGNQSMAGTPLDLSEWVEEAARSDDMPEALQQTTSECECREDSSWQRLGVSMNHNSPKEREV